ncbi:hypothetical protein CDAR_260381 [Caerostris darwini]|uniref:Uncharacterized protein n=1 Tax=Caerostris darwini TaxID=1538125 RepID=A0AAV4NSR2_9ARAC|nr:hypothetical protein CDAR_260381 [Caerostris darwini]
MANNADEKTWGKWDFNDDFFRKQKPEFDFFQKSSSAPSVPIYFWIGIGIFMTAVVIYWCCCLGVWLKKHSGSNTGLNAHLPSPFQPPTAPPIFQPPSSHSAFQPPTAPSTFQPQRHPNRYVFISNLQQPRILRPSSVSSTFQPPTSPSLASRHAGERRENFRQQQPRSGHSREHRNPDEPPNYLEVAVCANGTSDYPVVVEEKKMESPPPAYLTVAPLEKSVKF